ncbi:MAG: AAA family ATPase, partial [Acidimicrobiia bacterium]
YEPRTASLGVDDPAKWDLWAAVTLAFTPAAPVDDFSLFADRPNQAMVCLDALFQRGLHVALYGERGVGKTSLANVLPQIVRQADLNSVRVDCGTTADYRSIWRSVFRDLGAPLPESDWAAPLDPEEVRYRFQQLPNRRALVVIDELDRVEDNEGLTLLADTVKTLADHAVPVTLMFVGVADSVEALLGEHESIVRSIVQVRMPRMSHDELAATLDKASDRAHITMEDDCKARIVRDAEGLPHFVHLLGLHAAQNAVSDDRDVVTLGDLERAVLRAVDSHSVLSEYQKATQSPQPGHLFEEVLLACAFAPRNDLGFFRSGDVREPLSSIVGREMIIPNFQRHLNELSSSNRGFTLQKEGIPRHYVYRFTNPILQPFVKLRGRAKSMITEGVRIKLQARQEELDAPTLFDRPNGLERPS